jgi:hypothetical protein
VPAISPYTIEPIWEQFRPLLPERKVDRASTGVFDKKNGETLSAVTESGSRFPFLVRRTPALPPGKKGACRGDPAPEAGVPVTRMWSFG